MANKYFRQNFNKGGGADTGKAGERKSKTAVTLDKLKKRLKRIGRPAPTAGIKGLLDRKFSSIKNKTSKSPMQRQRKLDTLKSEAAKRGSIVMSGDEMTKLKGESDKSFKQRMDKAFKAKKGGRAALRMGTKKNFNKEERDIQKKVDRDALVFGAKKAIERAKNKENKSATAMATKIRKVFDARTNKPIFATDSQIMNNPDRFKPINNKIDLMLKADDKAKANKKVMDYMKSKEPGGRFSEKDIERAKKALNMKKGGRANMMGGGMMGRRFGMKEGTPPPFVRREDGKPKRPLVRREKGKLKKPSILERAPKRLPTRRKKMMGGGSLKPVDPKTQKGLSKLPTEVRNKMGYMKKGGRA